MKNQSKAYLFAFIAIFFWSTVGSAFKLSLRSVSFLQLLFFASFVSLVVLGCILLFQKKIKLLRQYGTQGLGYSAILGLLNPFGYYVVLLKAYDLLPAQEAVALNYIWPVTLVILSIPILKQPIHLRNVLAILISFAGTVVVATHGKFSSIHLSNTLGVVLALSSSLIWASFWIFNVKDKRDEVVKLFLNFVFGFIYIAIANLIFSEIKIPDQNGIIGVIYIGFFEMGITFVVWLKALQRSETTARITNLIYISPFLSLIFVNTVVGEKIIPSTIAGLTLLVTGILMQQYFSALDKRKNSILSQENGHV
ncbi:MAG: DMT family transporter [Bacteroidota bacterium]|nr:DMT family transporter [Bacteroidota bacterium]